MISQELQSLIKISGVDLLYFNTERATSLLFIRVVFGQVFHLFSLWYLNRFGLGYNIIWNTSSDKRRNVIHCDVNFSFSKIHCTQSTSYHWLAQTQKKCELIFIKMKTVVLFMVWKHRRWPSCLLRKTYNDLIFKVFRFKRTFLSSFTPSIIN